MNTKIRISNLIKEKSKKFLLNKYLIFFILFFSVLLTLPSIFTGLQLDDYVHYNRFSGFSEIPENSLLWGLFSFSIGDSLNNYMNLGAPWWTDTDLKINLFRPLSEVFHWLDYKLWPSSPVMMHIHSLVWYLLVILTVFWLLKRIHKSPWMIGLSLFIFAVDNSHGKTLGWISNRNAIIAVFFGVLSIIFHDIWRKDKKIIIFVFGLFFYICALLSGEIAIAACMFIFSYCIFIDDDKLYKRIFSFLPYFFITAGWLIMYKLLGFGASGSGAYISPFDSPMLFIKKLFIRMPLLFFSYWAEPPIDFLGFLSKPLAVIFIIWIFLVIISVFLLMIPLVKRNRKMRFWFLSFILSLIPITSTLPGTRLLFFASIAGACLLSQLIINIFNKAGDYLNKKGGIKIYVKLIISLLIFFNIIFSTITLPLSSISYYLTGNSLIKKAALNLPENDYDNKNIILVNPPFGFYSIYFNPIRTANNLPLSDNLWTLSSGVEPITVERININTIDIIPKGGFYNNEVDQIMRNPDKLFNIGDKIELNGMSVQIMSLTKDLRPLRVRFKFSEPLEDKKLVFLKWENDLFKNYSPPGINKSHLLKIY